MSFILDALKKSESERQRADTPALYEMKMAPARTGVATWLIVLAALLVINVVVLSVVLLRGTHSAAPQIDASTAAVPAPATTAPPLTPPANPTPLSAAPVVTAPTPDLPPPEGTGGGAAAAADDDAPAVEPPRAVAAATAGAEGELPSYEQMAGAQGANMPELKLDLHSYSGNPAERFVYLNMQNLREGQTTPTGVRVESITPDGAVLSWRGSRFFLHRQ